MTENKNPPYFTEEENNVWVASLPDGQSKPNLVYLEGYKESPIESMTICIDEKYISIQRVTDNSGFMLSSQTAISGAHIALFRDILRSDSFSLIGCSITKCIFKRQNSRVL